MARTVGGDSAPGLDARRRKPFLQAAGPRRSRHLRLPRGPMATTSPSLRLPGRPAMPGPQQQRGGTAAVGRGRSYVRLRRPPHAPPRAAASPSAAPVPSYADIDGAARRRGFRLQLSTLGPAFCITALPCGGQQTAAGPGDRASAGAAGGPEASASSSAPAPSPGRRRGEVEPLGTVEGFVAPPFGLIHFDSMRVARIASAEMRSVLGVGAFLGAAALRHGLDCGCARAEILAINDTDEYHRKLVRYYGRLGFTPVHEVTGGSLADLPHQLVWGGVGTRMDADCAATLRRWAPALARAERGAPAGASRAAGGEET